MVKIIEKGEEQISLERKIEKIKDIAKKLYLYPMAEDGFVINLNRLINVIPTQNFIGVNDPSYFDIALNLAKEYESCFGVEWTLKRNYDN